MLESRPFSQCSSGIQSAILSFSLDVPASILLRIVDKEGSRLTDVLMVLTYAVGRSW